MLTRRRFLTVLAAVPTVGIALAACGGSEGDAGGAEPQDSTGTPSSDGPGVSTGDSVGGVLTPDRAGELLLRIDTGVGAFMPAESSFGLIPTLLVLGDGTAYRPGAQIEIYPPPLLPAVETGRIDAESAAALLAAADAAGLLAEPLDYTADAPMIADAGATVVTFDLGDGRTYVHQAEALGIGEETSPARKALAAFVAEALAVTVQDSALHSPDAFAIWAIPVNIADYQGSEPAPTVVPWPVPSLDLTTAATCLEVASGDVLVAFETANRLTFFEQNGVTYSIAVRPQLPTMEPCA